MGLREQAERDLGTILEDDVNGPGWPVTLTDPAGISKLLVGFTNDIAQIIDPDTGQAVSGRSASVALRISSLIAAGLALPVGVSDASAKPWVIAFNDINGISYTFKIVQSNPDRVIGLVTCLLESYKP